MRVDGAVSHHGNDGYGKKKTYSRFSGAQSPVSHLNEDWIIDLEDLEDLEDRIIAMEDGQRHPFDFRRK